VAALAVSAFATILTGCEARHRVDHQLWTLGSIRDALRANDGKVATGPTFPTGLHASDFLTEGENLKVIPVFAESAPAAVVTTEIWVSFGDDVWPQPLYIQVTEDADPPPYLLESNGLPAPWIAPVGPQSSFYTPFWVASYAVVGNLSDPNHYQTGHALLSAGVPLVLDGTRMSPLAPLDFMPAPAGQHLTDPTWGMQLWDIPTGQAWTEEDNVTQAVSFLDFGEDLFSVTADPTDGSLVQPYALFMFAKPDGTSGAPRTPVVGALKVAGVGPLFSGEAADVGIDVTTGYPQPHFGGYWRLITALVPPAADAFRSAEHSTTVSAATGMGVDIKQYEGRVALDAGCFASATTFPNQCKWLDSQANIEHALDPTALVETEVTEAAPFVFYDQLPVKR
jgi:hypothetical protein